MAQDQIKAACFCHLYFLFPQQTPRVEDWHLDLFQSNWFLTGLVYKGILCLSSKKTICLSVSPRFDLSLRNVSKKQLDINNNKVTRKVGICKPKQFKITFCFYSKTTFQIAGDLVGQKYSKDGEVLESNEDKELQKRSWILVLQMLVKYKIVRNTILQPQNLPYFTAFFYYHLLLSPNFSPLCISSPLQTKSFRGCQTALWEHPKGNPVILLSKKLYHICCLYEAFEQFPAADVLLFRF